MNPLQTRFATKTSLDPLVATVKTSRQPPLSLIKNKSFEFRVNLTGFSNQPITIKEAKFVNLIKSKFIGLPNDNRFDNTNSNKSKNNSSISTINSSLNKDQADNPMVYNGVIYELLVKPDSDQKSQRMLLVVRVVYAYSLELVVLDQPKDLDKIEYTLLTHKLSCKKCIVGRKCKALLLKPNDPIFVGPTELSLNLVSNLVPINDQKFYKLKIELVQNSLINRNTITTLTEFSEVIKIIEPLEKTRRKKPLTIIENTKVLTVISIKPTEGPAYGGNTMVISGNNFTDTCDVIFGHSGPIVRAKFINSNTISVIVPPCQVEVDTKINITVVKGASKKQVEQNSNLYPAVNNQQSNHPSVAYTPQQYMYVVMDTKQKALRVLYERLASCLCAPLPYTMPHFQEYVLQLATNEILDLRRALSAAKMEQLSNAIQKSNSLSKLGADPNIKDLMQVLSDNTTQTESDVIAQKNYIALEKKVQQWFQDFNATVSTNSK